MTWLKIWLPSHMTFDVDSQRNTITKLVNSGVLSADVKADLRATAHVLAAVGAAKPPASA